MAGPTLTMSNDRRMATITFPGAWLGSAAALELKIATPELDSFIAGLGQLRKGMLDQPPQDPPRGKKLRGTIDPRWRVVQRSGDPVLSLRHAGFGWIHFGLPKGEAEKLGQALQLQAADPPQRPS